MLPVDFAVQQSMEEQTFEQLAKVRKKKKDEVYTLLDGLREKAFAITDDARMQGFFRHIMAGKSVAGIEYQIDVGYVEKYGDFYDILFVDHDGVVQYSIKKESDYQKSMFQAPFADSTLAKALQKSPAEEFAEFAYYPPSNEPAAFFIVPVEYGGIHQGWMILQLAANSLNSVLTDRAGIGNTGETYLVNEQKLMLTDSRFSQKSTILQKEIATQAVQLGYADGAGEKLIDDYRGRSVYSSFEQINVFGAHWLLVVEIDEAEVLTRYYQKQSKSLRNRMIAHSGAVEQDDSNISSPFLHELDTRVDMNEFRKTEHGRLRTYGVASCTAVAVLMPEKFGYLAHLSPTDGVFTQGWPTFLGFGRQYNNLLEEMFDSIFYYNILPCQRQELEVVIVVPHRKSINKIIQGVLDQGLDLRNIHLLYNADAESANVIVDARKSQVWVEWRQGTKRWLESSRNSMPLSSYVKAVVANE